MYSFDISYSIEYIRDCENRIKKVIDDKIEFVCELKYDGASISIEYENGLLKNAVTRGDGFQGDEVTANIRTIHSVPMQLNGNYPEKFHIRGEIILPFKEFNRINKERAENGLELYANPRKTASCSLKLKGRTRVVKRKLDCYLYNITGRNLPFHSQ